MSAPAKVGAPKGQTIIKDQSPDTHVLNIGPKVSDKIRQDSSLYDKEYVLRPIHAKSVPDQDHLSSITLPGGKVVYVSPADHDRYQIWSRHTEGGGGLSQTNKDGFAKAPQGKDNLPGLSAGQPQKPKDGHILDIRGHGPIHVSAAPNEATGQVVPLKLAAEEEGGKFSSKTGYVTRQDYQRFASVPAGRYVDGRAVKDGSKLVFTKATGFQPTVKEASRYGTPQPKGSNDAHRTPAGGHKTIDLGEFEVVGKSSKRTQQKQQTQKKPAITPHGVPTAPKPPTAPKNETPSTKVEANAQAKNGAKTQRQKVTAAEAAAIERQIKTSAATASSKPNMANVTTAFKGRVVLSDGSQPSSTIGERRSSTIGGPVGHSSRSWTTKDLASAAASTTMTTVTAPNVKVPKTGKEFQAGGTEVTPVKDHEYSADLRKADDKSETHELTFGQPIPGGTRGGHDARFSLILSKDLLSTKESRNTVRDRIANIVHASLTRENMKPEERDAVVGALKTRLDEALAGMAKA